MSRCAIPPCWTEGEFLTFVAGVALTLLIVLGWLWLLRESERMNAHPETSYEPRPSVVPEVLRCRPGHPHGLHGEVIYGLGGMGDASLCLRCGLDTYARIWPRESIREVRAPEDWPAIEAARALGLENN